MDLSTLSPEDRSLVDFTCALVRTPSVLGDEGPMAERVTAEMQRLDYDHVEIDDAGNAVGVVSGGSGSARLLLDAHMDTVDVTPREDWRRDPFGGAVDLGRIWGRGSSDMKGALAAMVHAAGRLDRSRLHGELVVSASVGEELIEGAALRAVMERYEPDAVIVGESTNLAVARAGRGRAEFVLETRGRPAHTSTPHQGVNAVHRMIEVIRALEALELREHPFVGRAVMALSDIISIPYPSHSVVPSGCRATYERRLIPGETRASVVEELRGACETAGVPDTHIELAVTDYTSYTGVEWAEPKWFPPWELPADHELVTSALEGLRGIGQEPRVHSYGFCTNATYSAGTAGVPTLGYGPSREELAHVVDEYLEIEDLVAAAAGYGAIATSFLGGSP